MDNLEKLLAISAIVHKYHGHVFTLGLDHDIGEFTDDQALRYLQMFHRAADNMIKRILNITEVSERKMKWAVKLLEIASCPDCDGSRSIKVPRSKKFPMGSKQCIWCLGRYMFLKEQS
jgi:hypothetical protein